MADALVRVLDAWRASVLIMDEVDVLLHPLRRLLLDRYVVFFV